MLSGNCQAGPSFGVVDYNTNMDQPDNIPDNI